MHSSTPRPVHASRNSDSLRCLLPYGSCTANLSRRHCQQAITPRSAQSLPHAMVTHVASLHAPRSFYSPTCAKHEHYPADYASTTSMAHHPLGFLSFLRPRHVWRLHCCSSSPGQLSSQQGKLQFISFCMPTCMAEGIAPLPHAEATDVPSSDATCSPCNLHLSPAR